MARPASFLPQTSSCLSFNLDQSFGAGGKVVTPFPGGVDIANDVAIQSDGKIVVGGTSGSDFALTRYNSDGTLDQTFGAGGRANTDFPGMGTLGKALVIQPDGKIVLVGSATRNRPRFALVRYLTDGSVDVSFGDNGRVITNMNDVFNPDADLLASEAEDVALQPDGKLVVVGTTTHDEGFTRVAVARYNPNGSLDPTFDNNGIVGTPVTGHITRAVALQADGRILTGGSGFGFVDFAILRYNTNGSLDNSFDNDGILTGTFGNGTALTVLAVQSDGRIIAAGKTGPTTAANFALARYTPDGSLDNTFDGDGTLTTDFGSSDSIDALVIQPDGRIVAAGVTGVSGPDPGERSFALARYNLNGSLDNTFDGDGKVVTDFSEGNVPAGFPPRSGALGVALQADGRIVAAGDSNISGQQDFGVARYHTDGSLDTSFETLGKASTDFPLSDEGIRGLVVQPDGKILATGRFDSSSNPGIPRDPNFQVARYNADGTLDATFGSGGLVITDFAAHSYDFANAIALQRDGRIVVVGQTGSNINTNFAVARYNSDGSLDTTFDGDGRVTTDFGSPLDRALAVAVQSNGKIVVAGAAIDDFLLARYNADGSLDTNADADPGIAFDTDGLVRTDFNGGIDEATAVVIQPDGKIVAGGTAHTGSFPNIVNIGFALARYNINGSLDTGFGTGGKVTTAFEGGAKVAGLVIQTDGKVVAAGTSFSTNGGFVLARYNANGALDTAGFGIDGKVNNHFGGSAMVGGLALQADGRLVVAGTAYLAPVTDVAHRAFFVVARYNTDGTLDSGFGPGGRITTDFFGIENRASAVVILPGGRIIAGGSTDTGSSHDFALARYSPSCLPPEVSIDLSPEYVYEDGLENLVYTFFRGGNNSNPLTVNFSVGGTALFNTDYSQTGAATFTASSGTVIFAAGKSTATVTIDPTLDSALEEPGETVILTITSGADYTLGIPASVTGWILNYNGMPHLSINDVSVTEGNSGTTNAVFLVTLSVPSSLTVSVSFITKNGTAVGTDQGNDYQSNSGSLTFSPGEVSRTITVLVNGDTSNEAAETFVVHLFGSFNTDTNGGDGVGVGTILNDDMSQFNFALANNAVSESAGSVQITVNRTGDPAPPVTVDYMTTDNSNPADFIPCNNTTPATASSRCDFDTAVGTLRFAANETTKTFNVLITQDSYVEGTESLELFLSNPTAGGVLGAQRTATLQILDDAPETSTNPTLEARNFVRQHYHDFLNREPDQSGWDFWTDNITKCNDPARRPAGQTVEQCVDRQRETTSAAFFLSPEFQYTGFYVFCVYKGSLGRMPNFLELKRDVEQVSRGIVVGNTISGPTIEQNRAQFETEFIQRPEFLGIYGALDNQVYVEKLFMTTGTSVSSADKQALVNGLNGGTETRATVLHKVTNGTRIISEGQADIIASYGKTFTDSQFNPAFVQMEYLGYLRRNSDAAGFNFWLGKMNSFSGDFLKAEMVKSFLVSPEYLQRSAAP